MAKEGKPQFVLNPDHFEQWAQIVRPDVEDTAEAVARRVRGRVPDDVPVEVTHTTSRDGRPVSLVVVAHASGRARQAKSGLLTRSAAEQGLEVTRWEAE